MKRFAGLAACAACVTLTLSAAGTGLPALSLPANTTWMIHLDAQALLQSPLGQEILTSMSGTSSVTTVDFTVSERSEKPPSMPGAGATTPRAGETTAVHAYSDLNSRVGRCGRRG